MSIKTKLQLNAALSFGFTLLIGCTLFVAYWYIQETSDKSHIAQEIVRNVSERRDLIGEYLLFHEERPKIQWRVKNERVILLLRVASERFRGADEQYILQRMWEDNQNGQYLFDRLVASFEGGQPEDVEEEIRILQEDFERDLTAQLLVKSQSLVSGAFQLTDSIEAQTADLVEKAGILFSIAVLIVLLLGLITFTVGKSIAGPLAKLEEGTDRIASGQFDYRVPVATRHDEIGRLGRALNAMGQRLKLYYDRERERSHELAHKVAELEAARHAMSGALVDLQDAQTQIEQEKIKDEAILESIGEGVIAVNESGIILFANKVAAELLGYRQLEMVGKEAHEALITRDTGGKTLAASRHPVGRVLATGKKIATTLAASYWHVRSDGMQFPAAITVTPVIIDGRIAGAIEVFRDITKETAIDQVKTEFVSLASHQLRMPLSAVNWYTEMLLSGDVGKLNLGQKKYLREIYAGNQRMGALVNALLNVSRLELGTFSGEIEHVNIPTAARNALAELKPHIVAKKIKITETYEDGIPAMMGDPKLLGMILQNLIANAVKYTPQGGRISLEAAAKKAGESWADKRLKHDSMCLSVEDSGCGIPKAEQGRIFTKLFRAENAKREDPEGTGLGLYIVKLIVQQAGGSIWFKSAEGEGTSFFVILPQTWKSVKERAAAESH